MSQEATRQKRVQLLGFHPDIEYIVRIVLEDEGYIVESAAVEGQTADTLAALQPDVLIIEAGRDTSTLLLLDSLRVHPATRALPVLVLGTREYMREQAQASGNVYAVLSEPFHLSDLVKAVEAALSHSSFEQQVQQEPIATEHAFVEAADLLEQAQRQIALSWVQYMRTTDGSVVKSGISTRDFLDMVPRILHGLILGLRHQLAPTTLTHDPDIRDRLRHHTHLRHQQGLTIDEGVHEYQVLRLMIIHYLGQSMAAADALMVIEKITALVDDMIRLTLADWLHLPSVPNSPI